MQYIRENLVEPPRFRSERLFEEMSYARWAAFEIVHALMDRPFDPPDEVVEAFLLKMALYYSTAKHEHHRKIFSIAEDAAEEILCLFRDPSEFTY